MTGRPCPSPSKAIPNLTRTNNNCDVSESRGSDLLYEEAVGELLSALAVLSNLSLSEEERSAARERVIRAALNARIISLNLYEAPDTAPEKDGGEEIDFWVPPHLRPYRPNQRLDKRKPSKEENFISESLRF